MMPILDVLTDAAMQLCSMLGMPVERGAVDEILAPIADDVHLAWVRWTAFP